ncbi:MAG: hypothetical protein A2V70_18125 [Planctomycetes bacterium RBG_13_63_9]|nr:MAG: hypothetical protein A2V70_18125 [Planctomycetes bacterium RBG_13_63_9]
MDERMMQFRVGVMVFATLLITGILVLLFNEPGQLIPAILPGGKYTVHVHFPEAPNVSKDTPVRKNGVLIGRVSNVDLPETGGVLVSTTIDGNRPLRHNEVFRITDELMGDAVVNVVPGTDPNAPATPIEKGETVKGQYDPGAAGILQNVDELLSSVNQVSTVLTTTGEKLGGAADKISALLEKHEDEISDTAREARTALKNLGQAAESFNEVVGDEPTQKRLRQALAELPDTLAAMTRTIELAEENLRNLKEFTGSIRTDGKARVEKIFNTIDTLEEVMSQMALFSRRLNESEGSLGLLLRDPQLYNNLNQAAQNVNCLSRQLKPILDDARVFTDKIARHPEQLGVRGAIQRSSGIK